MDVKKFVDILNYGFPFLALDFIGI